MADREKVIKGLEYHMKELGVGKTCFGCPYFGDNPCEILLIENVLELLKKQEPVKPITTGNGIFEHTRCGACGSEIANSHFYCWCCGRKVKWDD